MTSNTPGMCEVCGKPSRVHLTEIRDGVKTSQSFCVEHAPSEMRDTMPFGAHRTPAEEVAFLRQHMMTLDQHIPDPAQSAEYKAEIERLIADIEAGRRRLGDAE
jgi:protein-arginine kinase activator protein McsA